MHSFKGVSRNMVDGRLVVPTPGHIGETLYICLARLQVDLSHVKGLLSASSTTGVEMDMKEFSHTNDLIENAEEWMTRVKDMLESGEPTTLQALQALLVEAEGIPVQMEEQQLLTVGIKSRQWRIRVDATLAAGKAKLNALQDLATEVRAR